MKTEVKKEEQKISRAYSAYVRQLPVTQSPMSRAQFDAQFEAMEKQKAEENKIELTADQKTLLTVTGWEITTYEPENGRFASIPGEYLVCNEAKLSSPGFLRLDRSVLVQAKRRLEKNLEAVNIVLGTVSL